MRLSTRAPPSIPSASIGPHARIGVLVRVEAGAVVGEKARIGRNAVIRGGGCVSADALIRDYEVVAGAES